MKDEGFAGLPERLQPSNLPSLERLATVAAEVASPDFLLRLVQEREGLHALIADWQTRGREGTHSTAEEVTITPVAAAYYQCADELEAVLSSLAEPSQ